MVKAKARVVLKGAHTYGIGKYSFLKDVPQMVKGEDNILLFEQNAYFRVVRLTEKVVSEPKKKESSGEKKKKSSSGSKKKSKKLSSKKKSLRKK